MPSEHDQKLAWVTGGGTGIGKALSLALDREGWQVVISGRTEQKLQAVKELGRSISYRVLDVTDQALHQQVYDDICEELGIPELVVLNAGDYTPMPLEEFDIDLVYRLNRVNYLGVMNGLA